MKYKSLFFVPVIIISIAWNTPLPKVFVIGDSISLQYWPYLITSMQHIATLDRKQDNGQAYKNLDIPDGANGGDSRMVLAYLRLKIQDPSFKPDYMLLNCGLHDIKRNPQTNEIQVNEADYEKNMVEIIKILKNRNIQLIWMQTTPVVDSIHNKASSQFKRYSADVLKYNEISSAVCLQHKIPVIDLFHFTQQLGTEQFIDHVHYKEPARALQAAYISGYLQAILSKKH